MKERKKKREREKRGGERDSAGLEGGNGRERKTKKNCYCRKW
jgi:hypothetical protein